MTRIFTPEKTIKYAETRLFGKNAPPEKINGIFLHNAVMPSELKFYLGYERHGIFERVIQENGREPIFVSRDELHIPQYSGFGRRKRYEDMIQAYLKASGRGVECDGFNLHGDLGFESRERKGDGRRTSINYDNFAYDFVVGLFVPAEKYADRRIFEFDHDMSGITKIIFGPTGTVKEQAEVVEKGKSEYLDAQIVRIGNEKVLNLSYVYADQAGILIDKILREYESIARKKGEKMTIDILMFGRVGGLAKGMQRHDLVYPKGIIDEIDLAAGNSLVYPMKNILADDQAPEGLNLNVTSVIDETVEQLEEARSRGCICVEMETRESVGAINKARRRYNGLLDVNFGFVGHVSDLPLEGDTVADELDSTKGEDDAFRKIVEHILKHNQEA